MVILSLSKYILVYQNSLDYFKVLPLVQITVNFLNFLFLGVTRY
jgi:hypothetical protein